MIGGIVTHDPITLVETAVPESTKKSTCFLCQVRRVVHCCVHCEWNTWRIITTTNYFWLRKYARIAVVGHYLFLDLLSGNCSLLRTDNVLGQILLLLQHTYYSCIFPHPKYCSLLFIPVYCMLYLRATLYLEPSFSNSAITQSVIQGTPEQEIQSQLQNDF